ncbi:MAG: lauroyl acyltransferase [Rhodospirillaceae bacterium]|nr:lauroyl acyltransferase [Rhodospirillaceae bacterium]
MAKPTPEQSATAAPTPETAPEPSASRKRMKLRHWVEYAIARFFMAGLRRLNLAAASDVGGWLARTLGPISKPWRIAKRNVAAALPDLDGRARRAVVRGAFDNFGRVMAEYALLPRLWHSRWDGIIDVEGRDGLQWAVMGKRPVIVFTAHIGNWELIPMVLASHGKPAMIVYRAPNNPKVDELIGDIRRTYAAALAPKGADGAKDIVGHLQDGGLVFMVVDQKMNTGPEIPFFGRPARTGKAIARFAMRQGALLIPARCERLGAEGGNRARFRVTFEPPWSVEGKARDEGDIRNTLTRINAKIEEWVRATPDQWMWMHKRWPD